MAGAKKRKFVQDENVGPSRKQQQDKRLASAKGAAQDAAEAVPSSAKRPRLRTALSSKRQRSSTPADPESSVPPPKKHKLCVDWSQLNQDVLSSVINKLSPLDVASARLVCTTWRRIADSGIKTIFTSNPWHSLTADLAAKCFPAITTLDLQDCSNIQDGLQVLGRMKCLRQIRLVGLKRLEEEECKRVLARLTRLSTMSIIQCHALKTLWASGLKQLQRLDLTGCVNLEHLAVQSPLPRLTCLNLRECRSIAQWQFLRQMPALSAVDLAYCVTFNDANIDNLLGRTKLRTLVLNSCRGVTDLGLMLLTRMAGLRDVYVDGCSGVTESGLKLIRDRARRLNVIKYLA